MAKPSLLPTIPGWRARVLLICFALAVTVSPRCYLDNSSGYRLPPYIDPATGNISCLPGYFCRGFDPANQSTYPVMCPANPKCQLDRIMAQVCEEEQGYYEPYVCPRGSYCPVGLGVILTCPEGHWCGMGTYEPKPCGGLSLCPAHSERPWFFGSLLYLALCCLALGAGVCVYRRTALVSVLPSDAGGSPDQSTTRDDHLKQLVAGFRRSRGGLQPLRFDFKNLHVAVTDAATGKEKQLLRDVSGSMLPGTVTAIMGPSGCGKTTFLTTLLDKTDPAWKTSGQLTVNGSESRHRLKTMIGFVPQDDVLHADLSMYKNIYYSSEVRLPRDWTAEERALFRSAVIEVLGLSEKRDVVVGDDHQRGVSGGQRKRCSIGVDLVSAPLAMFLDEPTSGLDSTASLEVCSMLKKIAVETELTVGMVIHQPRVEIWNALDEVLLLGVGGRVVYQGPQSGVEPYFTERCGVRFPPSSNPADVVLDTIQARSDELAALWLEHSASLQQAAAVAVHPEAFSVTSNIEEVLTNTPKDRTAPFWRQVLLNHNQAVEKQLSDLTPFAIEAIVVGALGLVMGQTGNIFTYVGIYKEPYAALSPQSSIHFLPQMNMYTVMSMGLAAAPAGVKVFAGSREKYFREASSGHNRGAYFLGTSIANLYRITFFSYIFAALFHWYGQVSLPLGPFYAVMLMIYLTTYSMAYVVAMIASKPMAPVIAGVISMSVSVFNGFIAYPEFLLQVSYAFHASQIITSMYYDQMKHVYQPFLSKNSYREGFEGVSFAVMLAEALLFQAIAFVAMIRTHREKQH